MFLPRPSHEPSSYGLEIVPVTDLPCFDVIYSLCTKDVYDHALVFHRHGNGQIWCASRDVHTGSMKYDRPPSKTNEIFRWSVANGLLRIEFDGPTIYLAFVSFALSKFFIQVDHENPTLAIRYRDLNALYISPEKSLDQKLLRWPRKNDRSSPVMTRSRTAATANK
jgi:hypothetical protein